MSDDSKPKAVELTKQQQEALTRRCFKLETGIKKAIGKAHELKWKLAELLYEFDQELGWKQLGFESLGDWLSQPEIGMGRSSYDRLIRAWRDLTVVKEIPAEDLADVEPEKAQVVLPSIMAGNVKIDQALADARTLPSRDLKERYAPTVKYTRDDSEKDGVKAQTNPSAPEAQLDASAEPERVLCPSCGHWTTKANLESRQNSGRP